MTKGETISTTFSIENTGNVTQEFDIYFTGIQEFILPQNNTHINISSGKKTTVTILFVGLPEKDIGIYNGNILVSNGREEKSIDVGIELNSKSALFDVKTSILPRFKKISAGQTLPVSTELFNFGNIGKIDVYVTYSIMNSSGTKIVEEKESIAVETTTSTLKELHLPESLPAGTYTVFVVVKYHADQEASSSVQFEVVSSAELQTPTANAQNIFGGAIGITRPIVFVPFLFLALILVAVLFYIKEKKWKK